MFQPHRPSPKKSLFLSNGHPKVKKNQVCDRGRQKTSQKWGKGHPSGVEGGALGAQGWPRVSKTTPQNLPKFIHQRGPGPGAHPKAAKGTPGPPKSQKWEDFFNIFAEKIGDIVPKKRRAFRLVFYTFLVGKSEAQYKKQAIKKR